MLAAFALLCFHRHSTAQPYTYIHELAGVTTEVTHTDYALRIKRCGLKAENILLRERSPSISEQSAITNYHETSHACKKL